MPDDTAVGQGGAAAPGPGGPPPGATAPATVPPDTAGLRMSGMVKISMALNMLEDALPKIGGMKTKEGEKLAKALLSLRGTFGGSSGDLQRQELKLMNERAPGVNQPGPGQGQAFKQMIQSKLNGMGVGGQQQPPAAA